MPFQQVSLDQSIYNKKKPKWGGGPQWGSNVQGSAPNKATAPQRQFLGTQDTSNRFVQEQEAKWAAEDKARKEERKQQMLKLQEVGAQAVQKQQQATMAQAKQQQEIKQKVEENPEPFAEEQWKFFLSLDEEGQKRFTDQIFAPSPQRSTINGQPVPNAKTKYAGGAIADYWINKGYVMFDPKGNVVVNKPIPETEKGTYTEMDNGDILNTATGITIPKGDIPPDWGTVYTETLKEGLDYIGKMFDASWMQTMSTEEMQDYIKTKQAAYRDKIASLLFSKGMTDKKEINKLADLAVANYDWQKHIDEVTAGKEPSGINNKVVQGAVDDVIARNIMADPDKDKFFQLLAQKYGQETADQVLEEVKMKRMDMLTEEFKGLKGKTSSAK